jgi:hypothetical protein
MGDEPSPAGSGRPCGGSCAGDLVSLGLLALTDARVLLMSLNNVPFTCAFDLPYGVGTNRRHSPATRTLVIVIANVIAVQSCTSLHAPTSSPLA